jgi:hypothetical protein
LSALPKSWALELELEKGLEKDIGLAKLELDELEMELEIGPVAPGTCRLVVVRLAVCRASPAGAVRTPKREIVSGRASDC